MSWTKKKLDEAHEQICRNGLSHEMATWLVNLADHTARLEARIKALEESERCATLRTQAMQGFRLAEAVIEAPSPLPAGLRTKARRLKDMWKSLPGDGVE